MPTADTSNVSYQLQKTQHILRLALDDALRQHNLTTPQYQVLSAVSDQPGLSAAALARRCFVTPQTMTGIVNNLTAAGLIERAPDPEHRRIIQIRLTGKGADVVRSARAVVGSIEQRMVGELDRAEREALADLLAQCAEALARR